MPSLAGAACNVARCAAAASSADFRKSRRKVCMPLFYRRPLLLVAPDLPGVNRRPEYLDRAGRYTSRFDVAAVLQDQRSQLPAARSSLSTATANLAAALRPLGIDIKEIGSMQGAVNTRADDEQRKP